MVNDLSVKEKQKNQVNKQQPPDNCLHSYNDVSLHKNCKVVHSSHCHLIPDDLVVYEVKGDGGCFYNACAAHIYKDESQTDILRMLAHSFIVEHWWYFRDFFPLP